MAAAARAKPAAKRRPVPARKLTPGAVARDAQREAARKKANLRLREKAGLKADARAGRLGTEALLGDPRACRVNVLTALAMLPRTGLDSVLEALLVCRINGARKCSELSAAERRALGGVLAEAPGLPTPSLAPAQPGAVDRDLDRVLAGARVRAAAVELRPSEFAAARAGLETDPLLLRMVDRLVDAVRLYAERDDGGVRARVVAEQWIRFRNYQGKVASREYPPPALREPAVVE